MQTLYHTSFRRWQKKLTLIHMHHCQNFVPNKSERFYIRVAFIPFITAGDPDLETTEAALKRLDNLGSDVIELGVPYSVRKFGLIVMFCVHANLACASAQGCVMQAQCNVPCTEDALACHHTHWALSAAA